MGAPAEISFWFTACNEPERTGDMCVAHRSRKEHRKDRGFFVRRYTWIVGCKRKRRDETQEADILLQRRSSQLADLSQQKKWTRKLGRRVRLLDLCLNVPSACEARLDGPVLKVTWTTCWMSESCSPGAAGTDMALSEMFKQLKMHAGTERSWLVGSVASLQMLLCFSITSRTPETIHAITVQRHRKQVSSEPVMDLFGAAQSPATWSTPFL